MFSLVNAIKSLKSFGRTKSNLILFFRKIEKKKKAHEKGQVNQKNETLIDFMLKILEIIW